jgi:hypothetical protein
MEIAKEISHNRNIFKRLAGNIWLHDLSELLRMRRKVKAKDMNLEDWDVGTFPEHPSNVVVNNGGGWLKGMLAGGALTMGMGGGALGLASFLGGASPSPVPAVAPEVPQSYEYELEIISVDGKPTAKSVPAR